VKRKRVSQRREIKSLAPNCAEGLRILAHIIVKAYLADSEAKTKDRKIPDGEK
jgi:hypothetical protein